MRKNIGRVLAGLLLIALAVFLILGALGVGIEMPANIQVWQWIVGILLLFALIECIKNLEFVSIFVMLGFEVMVFEPQLGQLFGFESANWISNWLIFFVSLLVGIGFSMIFKGFSFVTVKVKKNTLGSTVKYIDCTDFKKERVENKMGELEVRFENVCVLTDNATLEVENKLGETVVYVPEYWNVRVNMMNLLGDIDIDEVFKNNKPDNKDDPVLTIKVNNKLGEVQIKAQHVE